MIISSNEFIKLCLEYINSNPENFEQDELTSIRFNLKELLDYFSNDDSNNTINHQLNEQEFRLLIDITKNKIDKLARYQVDYIKFRISPFAEPNNFTIISLDHEQITILHIVFNLLDKLSVDSKNYINKILFNTQHLDKIHSLLTYIINCNETFKPFAILKMLNHCNDADKLLKMFEVFSRIDMRISQYLDLLLTQKVLSNSNEAGSLIKASMILSRNNIEISEYLDILLTHFDHIFLIISGIMQLERASLIKSGILETIIENGEFARQIANGSILLYRNNLYLTYIDVVKSYPSIAESIAKTIILLANNNLTDKSLYDNIMKNTNNIDLYLNCFLMLDFHSCLTQANAQDIIHCDNTYAKHLTECYILLEQNSMLTTKIRKRLLKYPHKATVVTQKILLDHMQADDAKSELSSETSSSNITPRSHSSNEDISTFSSNAQSSEDSLSPRAELSPNPMRRRLSDTQKPKFTTESELFFSRPRTKSGSPRKRKSLNSHFKIITSPRHH